MPRRVRLSPPSRLLYLFSPQRPPLLRLHLAIYLRLPPPSRSPSSPPPSTRLTPRPRRACIAAASRPQPLYRCPSPAVFLPLPLARFISPPRVAVRPSVRPSVCPCCLSPSVSRRRPSPPSVASISARRLYPPYLCTAHRLSPQSLAALPDRIAFQPLIAAYRFHRRAH